jgi:Ca-activated chloride channel family protein
MAAHGELVVKVADMSEADYNKANLKYIIRQREDLDIIHIQDLNVKTKYLTGNYDLEVLTLPRMFVKDVRISQVKTTLFEHQMYAPKHSTRGGMT